MKKLLHRLRRARGSLNFPLLILQVAAINMAGSLLPVTAAEADSPGTGQSLAVIAAEQIGNSEAISIVKTPEGAQLRADFQRLRGDVTAQGLTLESTEAGKPVERFSLRAEALGRAQGEIAPFAPTGTVEVNGKFARWLRPGVTEEYSVTVDGVRQDFVLSKRPAGTGDLVLNLALAGARAEAAEGDQGVRLILDGSERALSYNRLKVWDALGHELPARLIVAGADRLAISVNDADAVWPIRIDPTFSDSDWTGIGTGFNDAVYTMALDGSGGLYVGGRFTQAGGAAASLIAHWDGSTWSAVGTGLEQTYDAFMDFYFGQVNALVVDSAGGVYAGGDFAGASGVANTANLAYWNGSTWSAVGSGVNSQVTALMLDGVGGGVYVGGSFSNVGNRIAHWDGVDTWTTLGDGVNNGVSTMVLDGSGGLYAAGHFTQAGGIAAARVAHWNGTDTWTPLGAGFGGFVRTLALDGAGGLYAGGDFTDKLAHWNGVDTWTAITVNSNVAALAADGAGGVYVGGWFTDVGNYIAHWDGASTWSTLGTTGMNSVVFTLLLDGDGGLYAAGAFSSAGGLSASRVAWARPTHVSSVNVPANSTYVAGNNLDFTANFTDNVTIDTGGGTPRLTLTIGSTTRYADYLSGSGTSAIVFRYTVQTGDLDTDGLAIGGSIDANGGTITDSSAEDVGQTLYSVGSTALVLVDTVAPTISSVSVPANATYGTGQNLDFTVNTNENITVNTGGGTPRIALTIGATTRYATYLSGSGTSALVFRYTVQASDNDTDGIAVAASVDPNSGTLQDSAANNLNTTLNSVGSTASVVVSAAPVLSDLGALSESTQTFDGVSSSGANANTIGQTFVASADGHLTRVGFVFKNGGASATLNVYAGAGTSTAPVATQAFTTAQTFTDSSNYSYQTVILDTPVSVTQGSTYTVGMVIDIDEVTVYISGDVHAGGSMYLGGSLLSTFDLLSEITVRSAAAFTEGGSALQLNTLGVVADAGLDAANGGNGNYAGASLTITRNGGASADDIFGFTDGNGISLSGGNLVKNSQTIAGFGDNSGTLTVTFTDANGEIPTSADVDAVLQQITYINSSDTPSSSVQLDWNFSNGTASDIESTTVGITAVNDAPSISGTPDTTVAEDSTYNFTPTAGDLEGDSLNFGITNKPSWAAFSTSTGALTGTAANDDVGTTSGIVISVSDGTDSTNLASFDLEVTNTNDAPTITGAPGISVAEDSAYSFTPTGADVDVGDTLTYSITNKPSWAAFSTSTGALTGTPANDDVSTTSGIVISVSDGTASADLASFDLEVTNTNDAPTISGTPATTVAEDSTYSFTPTGADVDVGDTLSYSITNKPSWASFNTSTGALTGTPANVDVGIDSGIVISVSDGTAGTDLASFDITVTNTNDAPTISGTPATSVDEDSAYSFTPTGADVDVGDTLSYSITNKPSWATFNTSSGSLTGTPANADVGTASGIVISVSDGTVGTALAAFDITVANTAEVAGDDSATTDEDVAVQVDVLANDGDGDSSLNAASTAIVTAPANGATSISTATGIITYTPNANFNGSDSFTYTVEDIHGGLSNTATVTLTINAVNDAPVAVADGPVNTPEDTLVSIDVAANDTDVDTGDSVDNTIITIVTPPTNGTATINGGQVDYDPNADFNGTDSFTYTIEDQNGATSNTANVVINVTGVNDLPTAANDSATVDEDDFVDIDVLANDSDIDGTLDSTTVMVMATPANGSTSVDALTGVITYTPSANYFGSDSFTYTVRDDAGGTSNAATVNITVTSINDAPVAANDTAIVLEDAAYEVNVLGNDSDVDGTLMFASVEVVTAPADGTTSVNATTGAITYTPNGDFSGNDTFTYRVQDNEGAWSAPATVTMTVSNVNDAPTAVDDTATTEDETPVVIAVLANDTDIDDGLDNASIVIVSPPANGSVVDNGDGTVTYTPDASFIGSDSFTYTVDDNTPATSNTATVTITVIQGNEAPVVGGSATTSVTVGEAYSFTPTAADADTEDTLTFSITGAPAWLTFNTTTGELSGTPADADEGTTGNIVISVSDGEETVSLAAFTIDVAAGVDSDGDTVSDYQEEMDETDPADPVDYLDLTPPMLTAPAEITVDAIALYTPVHLRHLLGLTPSADDTEVTDALGELATDNVDGNGCCNPAVENELPGNMVLLPPGRNGVTWLAEDRMGNMAEVTQIVNLRPLVSLSKDQTTVEGATVTISVILNGKSPFYPLTVPFVIDSTGTAASNDHNLINGNIIFTEAGQTRASISVNIVADGADEGDETLVVRLDDRTSNTEDLANGYDPQNPDIYDINSGARMRQVIRIVERNVAPDASLRLQQDGLNTVLVTSDGGPVTATVMVMDANPDDSHTFDWSDSNNELVDTDGDATNATLVFDPTGLSPGRYKVQIAVTDNGGASDSARLFFRVVTALPQLDMGTDTDGDGTDDHTEGTADSDDDGIPDYLDNIPASNVLPEQARETRSYLLECDPDARCRLGQFALLGETGGVHLEDAELDTQPDLIPDPDFNPIGGIFDFEVHDLPEAGASARIVLPQRQPIPENAVYRKFQNGAWFSFVEGANNALHSAVGNTGHCPPPGDEAWEPGLVAGHLCVQLTIEDGGPNDADELVNAAVEDPGAVSVAIDHSVSANVDSRSGGGAFDKWLLALLGSLWLFSRLVVKRGQRSGKKANHFGSKAASFVALLFCGTLTLSSAPTKAQDWLEDKVTLELGVYNAESTQSRSGFVNGMATEGVTVDVQRYKISRNAWQIAFDYKINDWANVQVGYLDLGDAEVTFTANAADNATIEQALEEHHPFGADGFTLAYRYRRTWENIEFMIDAGLFNWDQDIDVRTASLNPDGDNGIDPLLGLGVGYHVNPRATFGLRYQRLMLDPGDMNLFGATVNWRF